MVRSDESKFFELNLQFEFNSLAMCLRMICFCPMDKIRFNIFGHTFVSFDEYVEYNFDGCDKLDVNGITSASNAMSMSAIGFSLKILF